MKTKREKKKQTTAKRRAAKMASGDRSTIKAPNGMGFLKMKEGVKKLDILGFKAGKGNPYADKGEFHYERTYYAHKNIGIENTLQVCARKTFGKKCCICEYAAKLAAKYDSDPDVVKALKPQRRQLFQVFDHSDAEAGLKLLDAPWWNFGKRLDAEVDAAEEDEVLAGEFYALEGDEAATLKVGFVNDSFDGNAYVRADTIKTVERKEIDPDVLEKVCCLDELIVEPDQAELKKMFMQEDDEDDEDEDEVDDTEEEEDEDEEEEEEKPVKKKKKPAYEEEEEEEDEDDEEEEEEEVKFKKGDRVKFVYKKEKYKGTVKKVDGALVHVTKDSGGLQVMDPEDLTLIKAAAKKDEDDEEEEEEETPKKKSKTSKHSSKPASKDEDDEDEDEDEEEDDDDIPFDDEDEEEEEEEEEKPVKKKKKK